MSLYYELIDQLTKAPCQKKVAINQIVVEFTPLQSRVLGFVLNALETTDLAYSSAGVLLGNSAPEVWRSTISFIGIYTEPVMYISGF